MCFWKRGGEWESRVGWSGEDRSTSEKLYILDQAQGLLIPTVQQIWEQAAQPHQHVPNNIPKSLLDRGAGKTPNPAPREAGQRAWEMSGSGESFS